ncbi:hypothetical protein EMPS_01774 [Entomortierella parvispora]|uniref:Transmembrane protein n=1 Tax=Entomortierella parvispora TaxID=205924 RepID=A0A9P3LSX5_9FUNG|nr:hypothetical protein EMPS_01774 [Entomortierella parvispora]
MVVSGALAFIYAFWAALNHRRQPDNHRWAYLHGFCCVFVCAVLIAGSTLGFILGRRGVECNRLSEQIADGTGIDSSLSKIALLPRKHSDNAYSSIIPSNTHPDFHDGEHYSQSDLCNNTYSEMDRACAVLGIVAALLWLLDFCLIFGLCGSSGRYGDHRNYYGGRGQFRPDDPEEDNVPAGGHTLPGGGAGGGGFGYYGEGGGGQVGDDRTTDPPRKRELDWLENRTRDDPQRYVQGPIPLSLQQNYFARTMAANAATAAGTSGEAMELEERDTHSLVGATLSPPPRPRMVLEPPDSPTLPPNLQKDKALGGEKENTTRPVAAGLSRRSTGLRQVAKAFTEPNTLAWVDQGPEQDLPSQVTGQQAHGALQDPSTTQEEDIPSTASSPRYTEFPPGPACYVFDSSQHEYLPSFVNVAARIEQKHSLKHTSSHSSSVEGEEPSTATASALPLSVRAPQRVNSPRIMITGLGFDVMTRDDAEIAAEEEQQHWQERHNGVNTSSSVTLTMPEHGSYSPATFTAMNAAVTSASQESPTSSIRRKASRPTKINLPKSESFGPASLSSTSTSSPVTPKGNFNLPSPALGSPSLSSRPVAASLSPQLSAEQQQQGPQPAGQGGITSPVITAKPSLTKRKTSSKLSVVTLKNIQQQQQQQQQPWAATSSKVGESGASPSLSSSGSSAGGHLSDSGTASPRSPYIGDF